MYAKERFRSSKDSGNLPWRIQEAINLFGVFPSSRASKYLLLGLYGEPGSCSLPSWAPNDVLSRSTRVARTGFFARSVTGKDELPSTSGRFLGTETLIIPIFDFFVDIDIASSIVINVEENLVDGNTGAR